MHLITSLQKFQGTFTFVTRKQLEEYLEFRNKVKEGQRIEVFFDIINSNKSLSQLAKVHKEIRTIAVTTGYRFEEMKKEIKRKAGLSFKIDQDVEFFKSFADCSREELDLAIREAETMEEFLGIKAYPL